MTDAQLHGDMEGVMCYMDEDSGESAAMILTLHHSRKDVATRSKERQQMP